MASKKIGVALGIAVAVFVLVAFATPASAQNLADPKNQGRCNTLFNATLSTLYANDTSCADLIFLAFNATNKALCPPGGSAVGSPVHLCLNKNNTGTYASTWASIIASCEYMYIANRQGAGESETGFTYNDQNTCFQAFDSFSAFSGWLNNASPYGGVAKGDNAATLVQTTLWTLLGALALALMVLLQ